MCVCVCVCVCNCKLGQTYLWLWHRVANCAWVALQTDALARSLYSGCFIMACQWEELGTRQKADVLDDVRAEDLPHKQPGMRSCSKHLAVNGNMLHGGLKLLLAIASSFGAKHAACLHVTAVRSWVSGKKPLVLWIPQRRRSVSIARRQTRCQQPWRCPQRRGSVVNPAGLGWGIHS